MSTFKIYFKVFLIFSLITISCSEDDDVQEPEEAILSSENFITSFKLNINGVLKSGAINDNGNTITFETIDAELNDLTPAIEISDKATITPEPSVAHNFNNEVQYVVEAENGSQRTYTVIVNNTILSSDNFITSFNVDIDVFTATAEIDNENNTVYFEGGQYNLSALTPTIEISEGASISPVEGSLDFTEAVEFTVTAENGLERVYTVTTNKARIHDISTVVGKFSSSLLLYTGAEILVFGAYIDAENENSRLYLDDGVNSYDLEIVNYSINTFELNYQNIIMTEIPFSVPTNNYKIVFEQDGIAVESEMFLNIVAENSPIIESSNRETYKWNDLLIFNGQNLPDMIAVPSNGNLFLVENSNNYDLTVSEDRTELSVTLSYRQLFPSYYGDEAHIKTITPLGPNRRAGKPYRVIFD